MVARRNHGFTRRASESPARKRGFLVGSADHRPLLSVEFPSRASVASDVDCPRAHSKEVENASHVQGAVGTGILLAVGANSESKFIRFQRNENRDPVALQTAIAKYIAAGDDKNDPRDHHAA